MTCQVGNDIISYVSIYISLEEGNLVLRVSLRVSVFKQQRGQYLETLEMMLKRGE